MRHCTYKQYIVAAGLLGLLSSAWPSELVLSPNGYSGLGLVPIGQTLPSGSAVVAFDPTIPGGQNTSGYNHQIGFGLYDNFELVGRLATNDLKCNMFKAGACPPNTIRDLSPSLKWSLPLDWLKQNKAAVALGITDFGGAASYFKSYYLVGTKSLGNVDVSIGQAKAMTDTAMLKGSFGALTWKAADWASLSLQRIGSDSWAHAAVSTPVFDSGLNAWLTFNHRISDSALTDKNWIGWGVSIPLDRIKKGTSSSTVSSAPQDRAVAGIKPADLVQAFKQRGFYNPKIGKRVDGSLVFELENSSYAWNILDGAGVALGLIAGAYGDADKVQEFELVLTTRGMRQVLIRADASCVKRWLEAGDVCATLSIDSLNQNSIVAKANQPVEWTDGKPWAFRPEIIFSPTLVATVGTEYGAFDIDLGTNINTVLPLWTGATLERNHIVPLDIRSENFQPGRPFYASRLKAVNSRTLLHQLLNFPSINSQARLSLGTAYNVWDGGQLETSSQSSNGRHKLGFTAGSFTTDTRALDNQKSYHLLNYRYVHDDMQKTSTELTYGKFWGGDSGFSIGQRFWHGDTSINLYMRRSRMTETGPLVSFAGLQFVIPFTPRQNKSFEHLSLRGVSQWTYTLESRILAKENLLTGGYGEVPKIGDSLVQTFNRDRNSTQYLESNMGRIKNAYVNLSGD